MCRLLSFLFFLLLSYSALAQDVASVKQEPYFEDWNAIYVRVGVNQSGKNGMGTEQSYLQRFTGYNVGLGVTHALSSSDNLWINGEVSLSQQGFRVKDVNSTAEYESLKLTYVNIPVLLKYHPFQKLQSFYVGAGPQLDVHVGGRLETNGGADYIITDDGLEKLGASAVGVMGIHFARLANLGVEVRYQQGLTKFMTDTPSARHSVVQFSFFFPAKTLLKVADVLNFPFRGW